MPVNMVNEARRQHTARINSHLPPSLSTLPLSFLCLILPRCLFKLSPSVFAFCLKSVQGGSLQLRPTHCVRFFMFVLQAGSLNQHELIILPLGKLPAILPRQPEEKSMYSQCKCVFDLAQGKWHCIFFYDRLFVKSFPHPLQFCSIPQSNPHTQCTNPPPPQFTLPPLLCNSF